MQKMILLKTPQMHQLENFHLIWMLNQTILVRIRPITMKIKKMILEIPSKIL